LFGVGTEAGTALWWTGVVASGRSDRSDRPLVLYRWRFGERPKAIAELARSTSTFLDATTVPGTEPWFAIVDRSRAGRGRVAVARIRSIDRDRLRVVGGGLDEVSIEVARPAAEGDRRETFLVRPGDAIGSGPDGGLSTAWRVVAIREVEVEREVERVDPVFLEDGRVALEPGGARALTAPRRRIRGERILEVSLENADGERRVLTGPWTIPGAASPSSGEKG
jgi:hypothetical protein